MNPVSVDRRDIDPRIGTLSGEASHQIAHRAESTMEAIATVWDSLPEPSAHAPTYYDRPMLKPPVWELRYIPTYYFVGGAAGASLALGAAAQLDGADELNPLIRRCHWIGIIGSGIGALLLIADLGRPSRFLYMLRVFRPTSPMNVGAWILAVAPTAAVTAGMFARSSVGVLSVIGEAAGYTAGVFGLALATYTGVLVSNSAIPFWQESRRILPVLFGASAIATAGGVFDIMWADAHARRITRTYGIIGRIAELTSSRLLEHQLRKKPDISHPVENGRTGAMWRGAELLTGASLVILLLARKNKRAQMLAGVLGCAGSLLMRYAVHECGVRSARDPRASFAPQRARL